MDNYRILKEMQKSRLQSINILLHAVSENWYGKDSALKFLIKLGITDKRVIEPLINMLDDIHSDLTAQNALKMISGQDFGRNKQKWINWWENSKNKK